MEGSISKVLPCAILTVSAAVTIYGALNARGGRPALIVDDQGIDHNQYGRIYWHEIELVRSRKVIINEPLLRNYRPIVQYVEVILVDPGRLAARAPRRLRRGIRLAHTTGWSPVSFSEMEILPDTTDILMSKMKLYCPTLRTG